MPITNKTSGSPPERYYTTAPADYDWGWTTVLVENAGTDKRGRKVRLVEISDGYHADFQTGRYGSGGHASLTAEQFRKEVEGGYFTETPEAEHVVCLTRDFDFIVIADNHSMYNKIRPYADKYADKTGLVHVQSFHGGLDYRLTVRGPKAQAVAAFNTIASEIEAVQKGG